MSTCILEVKKKTISIASKRDLLYCMHEDSTTKEKKVYRYTRNQRAKELKSTKFRKLRQRFKPADAQECENKLNRSSLLTVNVAAFVEYMKIRAQVSPILVNYFGNEDTEKNQRKENSIPFRKIKLSSYINQVQADKRLSRNLRKKFGNDCILVLGNWSVIALVNIR
ncbi:hypothetical protein EDC94DRAFT_613515 [Helicostylum pulchrum]|nr:hypothetical protein EDC94DRAFT_613515 [Helicostylum pulchrum]